MAEVAFPDMWLHLSLGHVSDVKWSTRWGPGACGPDLASWTLAVDPANDSSSLRLYRSVQVDSDGVQVFGGVVSEMGRGFPRAMSARSWSKRAADFEAVDSDGNPTTSPRVAVTQAIANGLPWSNPNVFPNDSLGTDGNATSQRLDALLTNWGVTVGKRWGTDVNGVAFVAEDPTTPTWYLDASDLDVGVADDGLFNRVRARYFSATDVDGNPTTPLSVVANDTVGQAFYDSVTEYPMDLTVLGQLSGVTAAAYAQAQLDLLTVPQWLSRVVTDSSRLRTEGDHPAHLPSVRAGQMVRLFNVPNNLGGLRGELGLDVVLGEVEYDTANPAQVTIAPVGLAVRNLADALAQAASTARRAA